MVYHASLTMIRNHHLPLIIKVPWPRPDRGQKPPAFRAPKALSTVYCVDGVAFFFWHLVELAGFSPGLSRDSQISSKERTVQTMFFSRFGKISVKSRGRAESCGTNFNSVQLTWLVNYDCAKLSIPRNTGMSRDHWWRFHWIIRGDCARNFHTCFHPDQERLF